MPTDIVLPNLGFDSREARIVEWLKRPGDTIRKGEAIALIESDKANVELESIAEGTVLEQLFAAGDVAPVGATIARVGSAEAQKTPPPVPPPAAPSPSSASQASQISPVARRMAEEHGIDLSTLTGSGSGGKIMLKDIEAAIGSRPAVSTSSGSGSNGSNGSNGQRPLALPKVRKAARDAGIDLHVVQPSGTQGQITMADLQRYTDQAKPQLAPVAAPAAPIQPAPVATPSPAAPQSVPDGAQEIVLSKMRQTIGQRLQQSMQDAPHFYVSGEFDLENALIAIKKLPEPRPRINDVIQYLAVLALAKVPELNATYENGHLYRHRGVNLAIAISLDSGLITPVIPNAQHYSLSGLAEESHALIERTRANHLRPQDLSGGTFTISNLGVVRQVDDFTAVINPPQVAILAAGTVKQRPVVIDGGLHVRHTVRLTLSGDHRVVDGMSLANFMAAFQSEIERFSR